MVVGTIVGSSIFVQPSEVSKAVPSFGGMLLVWLAAGALTGIGEALPSSIPAALGLTLAFPLLLATLGFYLPAERKRLRRLLPAHN